MALLFVFVTIVPFSLMVSGFFRRNMDETKLVWRYTGQVRSFWAAEAGLNVGTQQLRDCVLNSECTANGNISYDDDADYDYSVTISHLDGSFYQIDALGTGSQLTQALSMVRQLRDVDPGKFQNPIEAQGDIVIIGSAEVHNGDPNPFATLDFEDLFGIAIDDIQPWDHHYVDPPNNPSEDDYPIEGITYIEDSGRLKISTNSWEGSGVLVVDGDVQITGGTFDGIMIVRGEFQIAGNAEINGIVYVQGEFVRGQGSGNPDLYGTVLVECPVTTDTELRGNIDITYDPDKINAALALLRFVSPRNAAWWEL